MFCDRCGTQLAEKARFCQACGTPAVSLSARTMSDTKKEKPRKNQNPGSSSAKRFTCYTRNILSIRCVLNIGFHWP
jgi:uncharacterized membrane protein YvbJ